MPMLAEPRNEVFGEMNQALARGRPVEFPCGKLRRVKKVSRRWELIGVKPYTVEWVPSWEGLKLFLGREEAAEAAWEFMSDPGFRKAYAAEMHPRRRGGKLVNK